MTDAAIRANELSYMLADSAHAPSAEARSGFIWAHHACSLLAFGNEMVRCPDGMSAEGAVAALVDASKQICDWLAQAPDGSATGLRGRQWSAALDAVRTDIPAIFFREPHAILTGEAVAMLDLGACSMEQFVRHQNAEAPDWAEVQLRRKDVKALIPKPALRLEAATSWMRERLATRKPEKYPDIIKACMEATRCTKTIAETAKVIAQGGVRWQGNRKRSG
jgi:ABC-type nitrate/sulfonate/bicarbonate transport system substrate-binding protein